MPGVFSSHVNPPSPPAKPTLQWAMVVGHDGAPEAPQPRRFGAVIERSLMSLNWASYDPNGSKEEGLREAIRSLSRRIKKFVSAFSRYATSFKADKGRGDS